METAGKKVRSQRFKKVMLQLKYSLRLPCLLSHPWQTTRRCRSGFFFVPTQTTWVVVTQNKGKSSFFRQGNLSKRRYVTEISRLYLKCICQIANFPEVGKNEWLDAVVTASHILSVLLGTLLLSFFRLKSVCLLSSVPRCICVCLSQSWRPWKWDSKKWVIECLQKAVSNKKNYICIHVKETRFTTHIWRGWVNM